MNSCHLLMHRGVDAERRGSKTARDPIVHIRDKPVALPMSTRSAQPLTTDVPYLGPLTAPFIQTVDFEGLSALAEPVPGPSTDALGKIAKRLGVAVGAGLLETARCK
jgi:hypothetical protein